MPDRHWRKAMSICEMYHRYSGFLLYYGLKRNSRRKQEERGRYE